MYLQYMNIKTTSNAESEVIYLEIQRALNQSQCMGFQFCIVSLTQADFELFIMQYNKNRFLFLTESRSSNYSGFSGIPQGGLSGLLL
jgi:hypothetical protein